VIVGRGTATWKDGGGAIDARRFAGECIHQMLFSWTKNVKSFISTSKRCNPGIFSFANALLSAEMRSFPATECSDCGAGDADFEWIRPG
jgi:hypothetical protein